MMGAFAMFARLDKTLDTLEGFGVPKFGSIIFLALLPLAAFILLAPAMLVVFLEWVVLTTPLWAPFVLVYAGWHLWLHYVRQLFINSQEYVVLEVRIPREISKSPRAMEAVFDGMAFGPGEGTFIDRYWKGGVRPWWSFEIASIGGRIHFYIWTRKSMQPIVEQQIYAQYPEVEIYEVEDYTKQVHYDPTTMSAWGCDFKLSGEDVIPIKTYLDYELEKDPKEEFKIDPIAHLFEYLSSIGPGEQVWLQVIIRLNKSVRPVKDRPWWSTKTEKKWKSEGADAIAKIREDATQEYPSIGDPEVMVKSAPMLTPAQFEKIKAIERSLGKNAFDAGIRGVYIAASDSFKPVRITGLTGIWRQFSSGNLNGFQPARWHIDFSYPWQDFGKRNSRKTAAAVIDAYKHRSWFWPPYETPFFVLTSEELATIYHFPSSIIAAPGLSRIPATKSEAPPNLPV